MEQQRGEDRAVALGRVVSAICSLPYPMLLGRKPIAIATMASITTTRMAAASISISFSVAQSLRWRAPCAKYGPRCNATCIPVKAVWLAAPNLRPAALALRPMRKPHGAGCARGREGGRSSISHAGAPNSPLEADASPRPAPRSPRRASSLLRSPPRRCGASGCRGSEPPRYPA